LAIGETEGEFLVLGADAPILAGLRSALESGDEIVPARDGLRPGDEYAHESPLEFLQDRVVIDGTYPLPAPVGVVQM
jgi:hypothetical protein